MTLFPQKTNNGWLLLHRNENVAHIRVYRHFLRAIWECNKPLKVMKFSDTFTCLNPECKQTLGMTGTQLMWEKVASLYKIRKATHRYRKAHREKINTQALARYYHNKTKGKQ